MKAEVLPVAQWLARSTWSSWSTSNLGARTKPGIEQSTWLPSGCSYGYLGLSTILQWLCRRRRLSWWPPSHHLDVFPNLQGFLRAGQCKQATPCAQVSTAGWGRVLGPWLVVMEICSACTVLHGILKTLRSSGEKQRAWGIESLPSRSMDSADLPAPFWGLQTFPNRPPSAWLPSTINIVIPFLKSYCFPLDL